MIMTSKRMIKLLGVVLIALVANCKEDDEEFFQKLSLPLKESSAHFGFYYDDALTAAQIQPIRTALENNYGRLTTSYSTTALPEIKIAIWSSLEEFNASMNNRNPGALGYVNGSDEVRMYYTGSSYLPSAAVHEFTHIVTLHVDQDFANNPRWLWEAIAQYESKSFVHPKTLPYMVNGNYPTLDALNTTQGNEQSIYQLGFLIGEFIIETWGYDEMRTLIENHGDLQKTFDLTNTEFESQWYAFVKQKYL
jgi:hypothetical protein